MFIDCHIQLNRYGENDAPTLEARENIAWHTAARPFRIDISVLGPGSGG